LIDLRSERKSAFPSSRSPSRLEGWKIVSWSELARDADVYEGSGKARIGLFVANNPINLIDPDGTTGIAIPLPAAPAIGPGVAIGAAALAGVVAETVIVQVTEIDILFARALFRWTCTASCNVQAIGATCCPPRVTGFGVGPTQSIACLAAKLDANSSVPPGCYKRHCRCTCRRL